MQNTALAAEVSVDQKTLDQAADIVYKKLDGVGGDPLKLPLVQQPIALLYTFQAMVDNGGFRYPLESDFPFNPPYSAFSKAYRQIGANEAADKLDRAIAYFPFEHPESDADARNKFMETLDESHELFTLGDEVCGDEAIWQLMQDFVLQHPADFQ